mgnify:CR=1 FL=1
MITGIDHVGIAVASIEEHLGFYRDVLGLTTIEIEQVPDQLVRVAMIVTDQGRIELLEPTSPESPIARFLEKNGEGLHHLALATGDVVTEIEAVSGAGLRMIDNTPRYGAGGIEIAFAHPKATGGVLLEFCKR